MIASSGVGSVVSKALKKAMIPTISVLEHSTGLSRSERNKNKQLEMGDVVL